MPVRIIEKGTAMGNLAAFAGMDPEKLAADASPAVRAALERLRARSSDRPVGRFGSFIEPSW